MLIPLSRRANGSSGTGTGTGTVDAEWVIGKNAIVKSRSRQAK